MAVRLPAHITAIHYDGAFTPAAGSHLPAQWERWRRVVTTFRQVPVLDSAAHLAWYHTLLNWCVRWLQCGHWSELQQCIFLLQVAAARVSPGHSLTLEDQAWLWLWVGFGGWMSGNLSLATEYWRHILETAERTPAAAVAREWLPALHNLSFQEQRLDWYLLYRKCQPVRGTN